MNKTVKTGKIGDKDYAFVADRLKAFREDNPNGLISTEPTVMDDGQVMFKTTILKDKANPESAEATGHALGDNKGQKAFEKLETISVGRALALLGYLAGGEIASSEEMEEFHAYRNDKIELAISSLESAQTIEELKETFMALGNVMAEKKVIAAKDARKAELQNEDTTSKATE